MIRLLLWALVLVGLVPGGRLPNNRIAHFSPYWFNNSLAGIRRAAKKRYKQIDQDGNLTKDRVPVTCHWSLLRKDGYLYWLVSGKSVTNKRRVRIGLRRWEWRGRILQNGKWQTAYKVGDEWITGHGHGRDARVSTLTWKEVYRLRRRNGQRLHSVNTHMQWCAQNDLRMMLEGKDARFNESGVAAKIKQQAKNANCSVYFMALTSMSGWRSKMAAFHDVGIPTVLLARGNPALTAAELENIDYIRGKWHRA